MPKLNIGGVRVNVGDEFLQMSPQQQEEFVTKVVIPSPEFQAKKNAPAEPEAPKGTPRGYGETFARGAAQGASFNLADELAGMRNAASDKIPDAIPLPFGVLPLRTLAGGARLAANAITGRDPQATKDYETGRDEFRTAEREGAEQNPATSLAGNVTGALAGAAMPGGAVTLPAKVIGNAAGRRIAEGALTGLLSGAASGAGEGETAEERLRKALLGGAIGGGVGGAGSTLLEGAGRVVSPLAERFAATVRGFRDPEGEAARRVVTGIDHAVESDPLARGRLTNAEAGQSMDAGGPAMVMDLGGETTRAQARSAANQSPEARGILTEAVGSRFEGQGDRFTNWLRETFHYPDADAQAEALIKASREVNKPAYAKAYSEGANLPWSEGLEQISQAPEVQAAIRKAMVNAKSEAAKMGFTPPKNPFYMDEATGRFKLKTDGEATMTPNLQFWDIVKRNLDRGDRNSQDWSKILREHLDEAVPSYADARAGAAKFFDADNALEAGQNFVGKSMEPREARRALAKMTPNERQLFQDGFVSKYLDELQGVKYRRDVLNQISDSPKATEKLMIALGPERANQLEAMLRVEGIMQHANRAVTGGPTTARQLAEMGLASGGATAGIGLGAYGLSGGGANPFDHPVATMVGLLAAGARHGGVKIEANVARKMADLLVSKDPRDLQRGVDIIRKSPTLMNMLRGTDKYIARVAGEEASGRSDPPERLYVSPNRPAQ
ncbi:hypothetical protein ABID65_006712 [Bradyrhizobium sp. S3.9.2]|uniref:hypothetical protein n=1 Tax=Bradyrhizobium sp. S3.9.2 TaxID=3156432 RepID=UPI003398D7BF